MQTIKELISKYSDEEIETRFKDGWTIAYWPIVGFIWKAPAPNSVPVSEVSNA